MTAAMRLLPPRFPFHILLAVGTALGMASLPGCPHRSPLTPPNDADAGWGEDIDPSQDPDALVDAGREIGVAACTRLAKLGCPEAERVAGRDSCVVVFRKAQAEQLTDLKPACVAASKTVDAVRACGTVRCSK